MNDAKLFPKLIEPGIKNFIGTALKAAHRYKMEYFNFFLNLSIFAIFCLVLFLILLFKYKGKPSKEDLLQKRYESHQYVLEKIKKFQISKKKDEAELITGLPQWDNEYDLLYKKV